MIEEHEEKNTNLLASQDQKQIGWLLFGGGTIGSLYLIFKRDRNILSWLIPLGMIAAGVELLLKDRRERIQQTGDRITAQLDELDPITRAEVIKYVAEQEIDKVSK